MEVRRLGADQFDLALEALRLLKASDGNPTPSPEYLVRFLSRPDNVLIVATVDGVPVGFLLAYLLDRADRDQQMMFLYEIGVAESHRRRGIGTRMITQLKTICGNPALREHGRNSTAGWRRSHLRVQSRELQADESQCRTSIA